MAAVQRKAFACANFAAGHALAGMLCGTLLWSGMISTRAEVVTLPLAGDFSASPAFEVRQEGPHRFVEVAGRRGYQPLSLQTKLSFPCAVQ